MLLPGVDLRGVQNQGRVAIERIEAHSKAIQSAAISTAKVVITAEEKLRQRVRSVLRVAVATIFFGISGLISLGANATAAFAKKVSPDRGKHSLHIKRTAKHLMSAHHRSGKRHQIASRHHKALHQIASSIRSGKISHGIASWYGHQFNHRKTASGVRFNTHAMMAAHRTLPFGTKVRVTNLATHKSCVVEITDRGPFAKHRLIDLSYAAAEKIGMTQTGTAPVELEVLNATAEPMTDQDIAFKPVKRFHVVKPAIDRLPKFPGRTMASVLNQASLDDEQ